MAKLRNKKTGIIYEVTEKQATDIMAGTWARAFQEIKEPKKPETPKELLVEKDEVKEAEKPSKRKKGDK